MSEDTWKGVPVPRWRNAKGWADVAGHEAGLWPLGARATVETMLEEFGNLRAKLTASQEREALAASLSLAERTIGAAMQAASVNNVNAAGSVLSHYQMCGRDYSLILAARDERIRREIHAEYIRTAGLTVDEADPRIGPSATIEDAEAWLQAQYAAQRKAGAVWALRELEKHKLEQWYTVKGFIRAIEDGEVKP